MSNVTLSFKWYGHFLVVYVDGEPARCYHREDLAGRTREPPPTPLADSDCGELEEP